MEERDYKVYLHISPSGKYYVGITKQKVTRRWREGEGCKGQAFYNAIKKYGWGNIEHIVFEENLTKEEAEDYEIFLIEALHSNDGIHGYNISNGGNSVGTVSEETKKKLSESHKKEKAYWYGREMPKETREKISLALRGKNNGMYRKFLTKEQKEKISERNKGYVHTEEAKEKIREKALGRKHSKETIEKLSEINKNREVSEETRQKMSESHKRENLSEEVLQKKKEAVTGGKNPSAKNVICEDNFFECAKDCANFYNINPSTMRSWLNGTNKMRQDFKDKGLRYLE